MKTATVTQKCKVCKGNLVFDLSKQALVCQKCGDTISIINNLTPSEKSFYELLRKAPTWQKETAVYQCEHCGAKSIITKYDLVVNCDYCGSKNINKIKEMPGVCPDTIVLFQITPDEANQKALEWLSKRYFMPNDFKNIAKKQQVSGIYFPGFAFNADVATQYAAKAVRTQTVTSVVDGQSCSQKQTLARDINGVDEHCFDDVLVMANDIVKLEVVAELLPFNIPGGVAFQQDYLVGYTICQASKEPTQAWQEAKKIMEGVIRYKIHYQHLGFTLQNLNMETSISNITYKYALLPIYIRHVEYKGKQYEMYINGQTGKVYGKVPRSRGKVFSFFAKAIGLAGITIGIILAIIL